MYRDSLAMNNRKQDLRVCLHIIESSLPLHAGRPGRVFEPFDAPPVPISSRNHALHFAEAAAAMAAPAAADGGAPPIRRQRGAHNAGIPLK